MDESYFGPLWRPTVASTPDFGMGMDLYNFLMRTDEWAFRRVERITFVDDLTIQRRTSIDFQMPSNESLSVISGVPHVLIPLALLKKEPLVAFNFQLEDGSTFPVLTRDQNAYASWSLLVAVGEIAAREAGLTLPLPTDVVDDLYEVAALSVQDSRRAMRRIRNANGTDSEKARRALMEHDVFPGLMSDLTDNFLLLINCRHVPAERRIVKFSYAESFRWPLLQIGLRTGWKDIRWQLGVRLGWEPIPFNFPVPAIDESPSFHLEVEAPEGLQIHSAEIVDEDTDEVLAEEEVRGARAHLYLSNVTPGTRGLAWVWLQPPLAGLVRSGTLFALAVSLLLSLLVIRADYVRPGAVTSLLLSVPGLLALLIVTPREHSLTTQMMLGPRLLVSALGLLPFAAAVVLMMGVGTEGRLTIWALLALASWILLFVLRRTYHVLKSTEEAAYAASIREE